MSAEVEILPWTQAEALVMPLRVAVFVDEQGVPPEMELDEFDPQSLHAVARDHADAVVGTGRLLPDGHIGRMAVRMDRRGQGVGSRILDALMRQAALLGMHSAVVHAQLRAEPFYRRHGFVPEGGSFMEAGIAHVVMTCALVPLHRG
jgi:predicted GNAT family N-acyltransferase